MDYQLLPSNNLEQVDLCVVALFEEGPLTHACAALDNESKGVLSEMIQAESNFGQAEKILLLHKVPGTKAKRVMLVGCGHADKLNYASLKKILNAAAQAVVASQYSNIQWCLHDTGFQDAHFAFEQSILALANAAYQFETYKSEQASANAQTIQLAAPQDLLEPEATLKRARAIATGQALCKDLGNTPANVCTPSFLAERAKALGKTYKSIKTRILEEADMKKLGMHSLLSVSAGSIEDAKLIIMEYTGDSDKNAKPHVIVGKGITFDTGGISLKPPAGMDEMKYDMLGAASVFGTLQAIADMGLNKNVVGIVAASENMPGPNATKPGDIVTSLAGKTIEILNTDAEGRLVLCDALTYAEQNYDAKTIVDIATLTGAMIISLGHFTTGVMSNDDQLAERLVKAGSEVHDKAWQLPLGDEYDALLESPFADIANIGSGRAAGSITAGCFLARFMKSQRWAHLDIAGTAWQSGKNKGATGRPVSLLVNYLDKHAD